MRPVSLDKKTLPDPIPTHPLYILNFSVGTGQPRHGVFRARSQAQTGKLSIPKPGSRKTPLFCSWKILQFYAGLP